MEYLILGIIILLACLIGKSPVEIDPDEDEWENLMEDLDRYN